MCGYCIEGSVTLGFVESQDMKLENKWVPIYLQETTDLPAMLKKTMTFGRLANAIDIVFCRLYEQFIDAGFDDSLQYIEASIGQVSVDEFLNKTSDCQQGEIWDQFIRNRN
jgi:hypothetical protein